jgi:hypothetical protein
LAGDENGPAGVIGDAVRRAHLDRGSERLLRVTLARLEPRVLVVAGVRPRLPSLLSMIANDRLLAVLVIPRSVIATGFRLPRPGTMVPDHRL